jgi:hypothetical protein
MGVARVTGSHTSDRERKGKGEMRGVSVSSETDFPSNEAFETTQGRIIAGFPCSPDTLGSLAGIYVATPPASVTVATVDAVSTD